MKCPICGKPTEWENNPTRPFCSERCRIIDLANWSSEEYKVSQPLKDIDESLPQSQD
ncbi:MAG TPA: DNA gyrase inhibitor YacG [Blastocatellia bacterium]|nr:DNA gyrase inhibitor YacG [Blastocatellia bacterium]